MKESLLNKLVEKGTIRGILALVIGAFGFVALVIGTMFGYLDSEEMIKSVVLMVLGFYFGIDEKLQNQRDKL